MKQPRKEAFVFAFRTFNKKISSRTQIAIEGVREGILILPHGEYRIILNVSPLNFELKSEEEQDAIIETYESFLNSVGSSLQILVQTRELDMDKYLNDLAMRLHNETEDVYRNQLSTYEGFIRSLISNNKILTRHFYIVLSSHHPKKTAFDYIQEELRIQLDIVSKGLSRLGMQTRQLSSLETLDLFYSFYNPTHAKRQPLQLQALHLLHTSTLTSKGDTNEENYSPKG